MPTETPRSIARHGGWKVWTPQATPKLLQEPWRHHYVVGQTGGPDVFHLPVPADAAHTSFAGLGVPPGTVLWVHNGGAFAVTVQNIAGTATFTCNANTSNCFVLGPGAVSTGDWRRITANKSFVRGPTQLVGFNYALDLTSNQSSVHVLTKAIAAGYDGSQAAIVQVRVRSNVVIGATSPLVYALDMGGDVAIGGINWHASSVFFLRLEGGILAAGGAGGGGGVGGTGASAGVAGQAGGKALRCPRSITITSTGLLQAGGGGGGGGNGSAGTPGLHGGGGGGGAGATVDAGGFVGGGAPGGQVATGARQGLAGSPFSGGAGGTGTIVQPNTGGQGGNGGAPGVAGGAGWTLNNASQTAGAGGAAGYAISRASGATVSFLAGAGGTVVGATIVE